MSIRTFDDATKKALLGLLPFAPGSFVDVTLDCFDHVPEDIRPVFRIRDFTPDQFYAMQAAVRKDGDVDLPTMIKTLQEGAMGSWDKLPDSNFNEIPFSVEGIANLPFQWIAALYWKARFLCSPNKTEREVLGSLPPPASAISSNPASDADAAQA